MSYSTGTGPQLQTLVYTLAYYEHSQITDVKSFISLGTDVIV